MKHGTLGPASSGHLPKFEQQRLLQAQEGCAHREKEDGGTIKYVLWAVPAPQRERSSREQEEAETHEPLKGERTLLSHELAASPRVPAVQQNIYRKGGLVPRTGSRLP